MDTSGKFNPDEYDFFLKGGIIPDRSAVLNNPAKDWISESTWDNLTVLDAFPTFAGIINAVTQNEREWKTWYMTNEAEDSPYPGEWENKLTDFQKLILLKSLRMDRLGYGIRRFVTINLGSK